MLRSATRVAGAVVIAISLSAIAAASDVSSELFDRLLKIAGDQGLESATQLLIAERDRGVDLAALGTPLLQAAAKRFSAGEKTSARCAVRAFAELVSDDPRVFSYPSRMASARAEVIMWVTATAAEKGLDATLERDVRGWIENEWPFESVVYPGRTTSWEEFSESLL